MAAVYGAAGGKAAGMLWMWNGERLEEQIGRASPLCPPSGPRGHRQAELTLPPPQRNASVAGGKQQHSWSAGRMGRMGRMGGLGVGVR